MQSYRVAFLGAGRIGQMHLHNLKTLPGVQVQVVADTNAEMAARGAAIVNAPRSTDDIMAAIQADDVDAVLICTPTGSHPALIKAAVLAGKPVWCEKPVALTLADVDDLTAFMAQHRDVPVMIGYMRRFDARYQRAKQRLDAGELGAIERWYSKSIDDSPPSLAFIKTSGGICIDMIIHDFDLVTYFVGDVDEVMAYGAVLVDPGFIEAGDVDTITVMLRFANGALGVIEGGRRTAWGPDIRTEIMGSKERAMVAFPNSPPSNIDGEASPVVSHGTGFTEAYRTELLYFFECLRTGVTPQPGVAEAGKSLRVAVAAAKSMHEGRPIKVADV
jgi:predicted dehydrogenase